MKRNASNLAAPSVVNLGNGISLVLEEKYKGIWQVRAKLNLDAELVKFDNIGDKIEAELLRDKLQTRYSAFQMEELLEALQL